MTLRVAIQMDDIASINITTDSTYLLGLEAQKRGFSLFYYQPGDLTFREGVITAAGYALSIKEGYDCFYQLGEQQSLLLESMDVILVRQDPPFDMAYITTTYLLEQLHPKPLVVNNPLEIRNCPEKWFVFQFKQYMPPTIITRNSNIIHDFQEECGEIVLKPLYGCGGMDIFRSRFGDETLSPILDSMLRNYKEPIVVQQFLDDVSRGDKRVILMDGEVVGVINRIPQEGEFRANMHVGGIAEPSSLNDHEKEICTALKPELQKRGLYLVGIDLIGGYLTEINVTSPTGLQEINRFDNTRLESVFWDGIMQKL